jgi:nucleotide-binding universal stress UspA family protein
MSGQIERILVPTDFSPCADGALRVAVRLAEALTADLSLLHAVVLHGDDPYNPARYFSNAEELLERLSREAREQIQKLESHWQDRSLEITPLLRQGIHPAPVILETAAEVETDLIVLGTHGRRGPARWLLGSVAEEVVRRASCPVLTVRQQVDPAFEKVETILVPIDFSEDSRRSLRLALNLAEKFGARLALLHLIEPVVVPGPYGTMHSLRPVTVDYEALAKSAKEGLEQLVPQGSRVPFQAYAFSGSPRVDIVSFAEQLAADLIVLGSRGLTGLERLLLGSTTEQVVRTAQCPVLTVHLGTRTEEEAAANEAPAKKQAAGKAS